MPTPSLLIVPARFKTGKMYSQIPTSGAGDFTVTRATAATRVNASGLIESVASGIPRLDYFASGGTVGCPALLVEPAATNGILNSTDTRTSWVCWSGFTSGAIDVIGVSGMNLTVAVSGSNIGAGTGNGNLARTGNNVALASGSTYTISFLVKKTGSHTIGGYYATITGGASGDLGGGFDVSGSFSSGSIYNSAGTTNRIRRVERFGTDVFRCSETFTMTASGTLTTFRVGPTNAVTSPSNPAIGAEIGFAAPQIELGSVPTSFIPTTTGSVTRNADVVSVTGAVSGSIGQTEGTIYAEVVLSRVNPNQIISLGSANDRIAIFFDSSTGIYAFIRVGGAFSDYNATIPAIPATGGVYKIALAYKANDYCFAVNGVAYNPSTASRGVPANMSAVYLGASVFSTGQLNDRIRAAALYTTRLSNAELAALTTP